MKNLSMSAPYIIPINSTDKCRIKIVGTKARNLSLLSADLLSFLPISYAINSEFLDEIFERYLSNSTVHDHEFHAQKVINNQISSFLDTNKLYAIRSSSVCEDGSATSHAGLFDSYLGICFGDIPKMVAKCLVSAKKKIKENLIIEKGFSILVQEMIPASKSGVAFSKNPINCSSEIVINSVYGLADAMVEGKITPDAYYCKPDGLSKKIGSKSTMRFMEQDKICTIELPEHIKNSDSLSADEIENITKITRKIEKIMNFPVDIEWAIARDHLFILQVRPITKIFEVGEI